MSNTATLADKWPRARALRLRGIIDRMKLCSCGSDAHWECVLEVLEEAEAHSADADQRSTRPNSNPDGFYRDKWFEFAAKVVDSWNLLEHGGSIGWAWLTDDGELLLEFLRDFGIKDHDMSDNSGHPMWSIEYGWDEETDQSDSYSEWERSL